MLPGILRFIRKILTGIFLLVFFYQLWILGHVWWWRDHNLHSTSFMRLQLREMRQQQPDAQLQQFWVSYNDIPIHLKRAVVAAEDDHFMTHNGFDWQGMQSAIKRNQQSGQSVRGGSTITQQLAKNMFLSPSRSYIRKAQEAVITVMLETLWSKRRILEVYLNVVEWGRGLYGCEAAARHYFTLSATQLGPAEAARMAVMLPNPRVYGENFGPVLQQQAEKIRVRMKVSKVPE